MRPALLIGSGSRGQRPYSCCPSWISPAVPPEEPVVVLGSQRPSFGTI